MQLPQAFKLTSSDDVKMNAHPFKEGRSSAIPTLKDGAKHVHFSAVFADLKAGDSKVELTSKGKSTAEHTEGENLGQAQECLCPGWWCKTDGSAG